MKKLLTHSPRRHTEIVSVSLLALILSACAGTPELISPEPQKKGLDFSANRPKQVTVGPEDTVYGIAYQNGISTKALVILNDIPAPYELRMGQVLELPQPNEHIVSPGETLQDVAAMYGVNMDALARENEITTTASLSPKQRLTIPPADTDPVVAPPTPVIAASSLAPLPLIAKKLDEPKGLAAKTPSKTALLPDDLADELAQETGKPKKKDEHEDEPGVLPLVTGASAAVGTTIAKTTSSKPDTPKPPVVKAPPVAEIPKVAEPAPKEEALVEATEFAWPVQGPVVSKFGTKTGKAKNDGINIKVPEGTAVKAAQSGEVIYAGNELKGFGNLILIKHPNGLKSAYAHNKEILVKKGDKVKQGQPIAKSGKNGEDAQLHFEIREGTKAIDPMTKLGS
ncbi:M23 family metallopeptidase [Candidatus Bealeia paramacronuclearis]|uniref:M23 family metallopeptidase n=1 Tax=Candidatus Bealeia paramacronuclearis TaxID=1921001 RepID=A0ABZ2C1Y3_9PROT|nr:M23 family metallopeptidase [Candidatus Bealeia paramacronuclearis]